jgi:Family of unknown function (DUF6941)
MPELDYALLCDYVRAEGVLAHVVAANVDTVLAPTIPTGRNLGLLVVLKFSEDECGRAHQARFRFYGPSGDQLVEVTADVRPEWEQGLPDGWLIPANLGLNIGLPLPEYGEYHFDVLIGEEAEPRKVLKLRLLELPMPPPS